MTSESAAASEVVANFSRWSADRRFTALRSLIPDDGDASLLAPFLLAVAADVSEDDLVRIEAVRVFEILPIDDDALAEKCRGALIHLARTDGDWDVRNASGCAVFGLPGAERDLETMRAVIASEQEDFVRENVGAALRMFLRRRDSA